MDTQSMCEKIHGLSPKNVVDFPAENNGILRRHLQLPGFI